MIFERTAVVALLSLGVQSATVCNNAINIGFNVQQVSGLASSGSRASWETGTQSQTLLELSDPYVSVFSDTAFPNGNIPKQATAGSTYAKRFIQTSGNTLAASSSAGDPASLGVAAILLGQSDSSSYSAAATRQVNTLLRTAPRYSNGAISHRNSDRQLWSDFIYMAPPTIAYQAVAAKDQSLLRESVNQISLYRDVLRDSRTGLWRHIAGGNADAGTWSTGNGWVLGGIARVLATIKYWPTSSGWTSEQQRLIGFAKEIIDGAIRVGPESRSGLLRNYISDASSFPEAAGTAMIVANIYRMAVLAPNVFANSQYLAWADARRAAVVRTVGSNGVLRPVINPYKYRETSPYSGTSPEAQSFAVLMYAAYRDCICAGYCKA
ncbi:glycosyl hydrolase family 88-domain-containing protein [Paraphoma chrysanthemicola]|nr:glycosyl hydrolase family 88-domain-containing protein [Paraphoma chrysanthemicola]